MKKILVVGLVLLMAVVAFAGDEEEMQAEGSMAGEMMMPQGSPAVWFEIGAQNVEQAREFYKALFGFEMNAMEGMEDYYGFSFMGEDIGGLMKYEKPYVTVYFAVENVTASLNKAVELGGEIVMEETPLEDPATFGMFKDPEGNIIGLWASDEKKMMDKGEMMEEHGEMMGEEGEGEMKGE